VGFLEFPFLDFEFNLSPIRETEILSAEGRVFMFPINNLIIF
jgi:hypothetical protein